MTVDDPYLRSQKKGQGGKFLKIA